jgi:hypothetical protein
MAESYSLRLAYFLLTTSKVQARLDYCAAHQTETYRLTQVINNSIFNSMLQCSIGGTICQ